MAGLKEREERRKNSVVAQIAGVAEPEQSAAATSSTGIQLKPKPETRTARIQIYSTPTLKVAAEQKANSEGYSINEVINQLLEKWLSG